MTEQEYAAHMVFFALLNAHVDGLNGALDRWVDYLPASVRAEMLNHVKGTLRLGETLGASDYGVEAV